MTKLLEQAFSEISRLPEAEQNVIAEALMELMPDAASDREWERLTSDPRSEKLLERMVQEAEAEIARGEVRETDPGQG